MAKTMARQTQAITAIVGLLAVALFVVLFVVFLALNPGFDALEDFISKLGSKGQPYALYWNLSGFVAVGLLLAIFGWLYGRCRNDRLLGACLVIAACGFALAGIPTDFSDPESPLSAAHFVSVCLSLAGFCFGLARLTGSKSTDFDRAAAYGVIGLTVVAIACVSGGVLAEPVAHRIVLAAIFTWVALNAIRLLRFQINPEFATAGSDEAR
ncbi:MAG: DUF998 domain-containing protein [Planctomycetota bacterium]